MKLYHYWRSSCSWRVRAALAAKGLEFEGVVVDISAGAMKQDAPDYVAQNPMRQVPALELEVGGVRHVLAQSLPIIEYLEEAYPDPPLFPQDPIARARARQIAEVVNAGIQPLQNIRVLERIAGHGADQVQWAKDVIGRGLDALEATISETAQDFCLGNVLSVADIFVYPQMFNAKRFSMPLDAWPNLRRIAECCETHPVFVATHPDRASSAMPPPAAGA